MTPVSFFSIDPSPFFPKEKTEIPPKSTKDGCDRSPFCGGIIRKAIVKVLNMNEHITNMIKLKFIRNRATLKITSNTDETMTFDKSDIIVILDLRSLGYYKIK